MEISLKEGNKKYSQPSIYPFYIKFTSQKQKHQFITNPFPYSSVSTQPFPDDSSDHQDQYLNQSFESYNSQEFEQYIDQLQQEIQDSDQQNRTGEDDTLPIIKASAKNVSQISDEYQCQVDDLRRANEKMVRLKQQYRMIEARYRYNLSVLHRQRRQLQALRTLRDKALDCDYEFHLSQQYQRGRAYSHQISSSISKEVLSFKKAKYRRLKKQKSINDPSDSCCVLSNSRIFDSDAVDLFSVAVKREQILNKRRLEQINRGRLAILDRKQEQYRKILSLYDKYLAKGNSDSFQKYKMLVEGQVQLKKNMLKTVQAGIELDISTIKKELITVNSKLALYQDEKKEQEKDKQVFPINKCIINNKYNQSKMTKKIETKVLPYHTKLDKIETPKSKIKIAFNEQATTPLAKQKLSKLFNPSTQRYYRQHTTQN